MYIEFDFDDRHWMTGNVSEIDVSVDRQKRTRYSVEEFKIFTLMRGMDYEITNSFSEEQLAMFEGFFMEYAIQEVKEAG